MLIRRIKIEWKRLLSSFSTTITSQHLTVNLMLLFAVQSVPILIRYYKIFKSLKPNIRIGAVFTYAANSQDDELTGMNHGFVSDSAGEADDLQEIMDDYNKMYGTSFTQENFRAYCDDINLRLKKKRPDMKSLDLCLVVGMFLHMFRFKEAQYALCG